MISLFNVFSVLENVFSSNLKQAADFKHVDTQNNKRLSALADVRKIFHERKSLNFEGTSLTDVS